MRPVFHASLTAALALGACTNPNATDNSAEANRAEPANAVAAADDASPAPLTRAAPAAPATPVTPAQPASPAPDAASTGEEAVPDDSAEGAAQVVQRYYALLEAGKYGQAYALWEPRAVGMTRAAFAASFAKYREYHARIGAPGRVDAGAGQRYVTVPVQVYGRLRDGDRPFAMRGSVILHRTADIDGATAEQRSWRIRETDIKPRPGEAAPSPGPTEDNRSRTVFRCIDGSRMAATFDPDNRRVTIVRNGQTLVLRQRPSGSGIRYGDGRTTFSGKGDNMLFETEGQAPLPCSPIRPR